MMRTTFAAMCFACVGIVFGVAPTVAHHLHEATIRQCVLHQWPAEQAEAHLKFCKEYLEQQH